MSDPKPLIGIIGGSGIYDLPGFTSVTTSTHTTPWGSSNPITILSTPQGAHVAFLARHAPGHVYTPSTVPYRANIAALKHLGCKAIIAFTAVGSLKEELRPGDFVLPDQYIDFTKGLRPSTFFEDHLVGHVSMAKPFNATLRKIIMQASQEVKDSTIHTDKTGVTIEGPTFSTKAESEMFRMLGGDIVNMTAVPECKLAREAEVAYQSVAMVTDYDCWHPSTEAVTVDMVVATMAKNAHVARQLVGKIIERLMPEVEKEDGEVVSEAKCIEGAVMTKKELWKGEVVEKMRYLYPTFFD